MKLPLTTTLNRIWPFLNYNKISQYILLEALGKDVPGDEVITYQKVAESIDLHDTLRCCGAEPEYGNLWRLYAVWCARQVQNLMTDPRSIEAMDVAERYTRGEATDGELTLANDAAWTISKEGFTGNVAWLSAAGTTLESSSDAAKTAANWASNTCIGESSWYGVLDSQKQAFIQLVTDGTLPG